MHKDYLRIFARKSISLFKGAIYKTQLIIEKNKILSLEPNYSILENSWKNRRVSCITENRALLNDKGTYDVSIVIPLYNSENFLHKCLKSFLNQKTNYKYELVLIDDGSTDNTLKTVKEYQKDNPKLIKFISQKNKGISAARNAGMDLASGNYIGFVDHDDFVSDNYIEELVSAAYKEKADIVRCSFAIVKNDKITQSNLKPKKVIDGKMGNDLFCYNSYIWGGIYKSELVSNIKFPEGYWYEDMITRSLLYQRSNKFVDVGQILYYKTSHGSNASATVWSNKAYKCLEQLYLPESLINDYQSMGYNPDVYTYQCLLLEYSKMLANRISNLSEEIKQQAFLCAREILLKYYKKSYDCLMTSKCQKWNKIILNKNYNKWKIMSKL